MGLSDAIRIMGTTARISGVSDLNLVAEVEAHQRKLVAAKPGLAEKNTVAIAQGMHGDLYARPIQAMLELARGTALNDDPEIAAVARRWSVLRHLGVFALDPSTGGLRLNQKALRFIGPNQRRVLSEELGIGFGIVAAKAWCRARNRAVGPITAIDVDRALYRGDVPQLRRNGDRQPDYLLSYPDPATPSAKVFELLETKGTVSVANAKGQLGRAVTQLAGLTVSGRPMTGIATATVSSNKDGITVFTVDPEESPITWTPSDEQVDRRRTGSTRLRRKVSKLDVDMDDFFSSAVSVDNAALAEYSGQYDSAINWLPARGRRGSGRGNIRVQRETEIGTFVGVEYVVEVGDGSRLRLFQGVERHVAEQLAGNDASAVAHAQHSFATAASDRGSDLQVDDSDAEKAAAIALSSDGSLLELASD